MMTGKSVVQKEPCKCLHINCLLRFPFFKANECFRFKHNHSLLITVFVTLLLPSWFSTCDAKRQKDEPSSWNSWPSASADLKFAGEPESCRCGDRSRNIHEKIIINNNKVLLNRDNGTSKKWSYGPQGTQLELGCLGLQFKCVDLCISHHQSCEPSVLIPRSRKALNCKTQTHNSKKWK